MALRLRRICSKEETFDKRNQEYKQYFVNRDYDADKVEHHFSKVKLITREESLKPAKRQRKNIIPFITRFDPRIPNLRSVVRKNLKILYSDPDNKKLFPSKDFVVGFSRARNLKEILVPTRPPVIKDRTDSNLPPGCYKCKAKVCDICKNYLAVGNKFKSLSTKDTFRMKHRMDCNAINVIYLITCTACKLQYVGSSVRFKPRFREHKSDIKLKKKTKCRTADHWASCHSNLDSLEIMLIEKVFGDKNVMEALLQEREIYWQHTLMTLEPYGLNKRDELYVKRKYFPEY